MDYRKHQESIADQLEAFEKRHALTTLNAIDESNIYFSHNGCDVCNSGGSDVYECHGYSSKHDEIFDGFDVCHECLCVEYNGIN